MMKTPNYVDLAKCTKMHRNCPVKLDFLLSDINLEIWNERLFYLFSENKRH